MNAAIHLRPLALLLAAGVMALASQFAAAHGGHAHEQQAVPESPAVERAAVQPGLAVLQVSRGAALSKPCSGGSGGSCCCARPSAHVTGGKTIIVNSGGWTRPAPLQVARSPLLPAVPPLQSQVVLSPALPRAPPFFS